MKITEYKKENLLEIIKNSASLKDVFIHLNYSSSGNAYKRVKNYLDSINIDYSSLTNKRWSSKEKNNDDVFIDGSNFCGKSLKNKILKHKLLEYKCCECGNTGEWNNKKLSLQLDHKNGVSNDNRLENLRFLCPNCHSQTPTFAGKNNKMLP